MAEPFIGEIKMVGFDFAPRGWAFCNGQLLSIAQNTALFSLLGTTYGGDGRTTFALPDLRGRTPIGFGGSTALGQSSGSETVTVLQAELPAHNHAWNAANQTADKNAPRDRLVGMVPSGEGAVFSPATDLVAMEPQGVVPVGGSQPHANMQPFLVLNFCIALAGIFPSRN